MPASFDPPDWFVQFMRGVCAAHPAWPCTKDTVRVYWLHLHDVAPQALLGAFSLHESTSRFAPSISDLRTAAKAPQRLEVPTAAEAWDELWRNRGIALSCRYESRPEKLAQIQRRIRWTTEACRRAAQTVGWRDNWDGENISTLRAQFERYYNAIKDKQERIDDVAEVRTLTDSIGGMIGRRGLAELYGPGYCDQESDRDAE